MSYIIIAILAGIAGTIVNNILAALVSAGVTNIVLIAVSAYVINKKYGTRIRGWLASRKTA